MSSPRNQFVESPRETTQVESVDTQAKQIQQETDSSFSPKAKTKISPSNKSRNEDNQIPKTCNYRIRQWSKENMLKALHACRTLAMTPSAAARAYNVPRRTLSERVNKNTDDSCFTSGKKASLAPDDFDELMKIMRTLINGCFALNLKQLERFILDYDNRRKERKFKKAPSVTWWKSFKEKIPDEYRDHITFYNNLNNNVPVIDNYFTKLKKAFDDNDFYNRPEDIYYCDDLIINLNNSSNKAIIRRRLKSLQPDCEVFDSEYITLHACITADGNSVPPFIIFKHCYPTTQFKHLGPLHSQFGTHPVGQLDSKLILKWLVDIFIPHAQPSPDKKVILLMDSNTTLISIEVYDRIMKENILLFSVPSYLYRMKQPIEYEIFETLNNKLPTFKKSVSKPDILKALKASYRYAFSKTNIRKGFKNCGILPFKPNVAKLNLETEENLHMTVYIDIPSELKPPSLNDSIDKFPLTLSEDEEMDVDNKESILGLEQHFANEDEAIVENNSKEKVISDQCEDFSFDSQIPIKKEKFECEFMEGRQLSVEQEKDICSFIDYMSGRGFSLTSKQVSTFAWAVSNSSEGNQVYTTKAPCDSWSDDFKERNKYNFRMISKEE